MEESHYFKLLFVTSAKPIFFSKQLLFLVYMMQKMKGGRERRWEEGSQMLFVDRIRVM